MRSLRYHFACNVGDSGSLGSQNFPLQQSNEKSASPPGTIGYIPALALARVDFLWTRYPTGSSSTKIEERLKGDSASLVCCTCAPFSSTVRKAVKPSSISVPLGHTINESPHLDLQRSVRCDHAFIGVAEHRDHGHLLLVERAGSVLSCHPLLCLSNSPGTLDMPDRFRPLNLLQEQIEETNPNNGSLTRSSPHETADRNASRVSGDGFLFFIGTPASTLRQKIFPQQRTILNLQVSTPTPRCKRVPGVPSWQLRVRTVVLLVLSLEYVNEPAGSLSCSHITCLHPVPK